MMNKRLSEEEKKYEREFCNLLIERITHSGGSLQFQHLCGLIQQAKFEIRNAFGSTKSELMKFLKAHPKIFQIDSTGIVTISDCPVLDNIEDFNSDKKTEQKESLHRVIEKGKGFILKRHADFGIIEGTEPIKIRVHFDSEAFFNNKDCLLSDSGLLEGDEVYFNAVHYDDNFEIKFRATKVWQNLDKNTNKNYASPVSKEINGQGIVKKLHADYGFISVIDKTEGKIFFHKTSVKDCDYDDLTKFLKNGDCVEFFAIKIYSDSKSSKWQAKSVRKKSKVVESLPNINPVQTKLENQQGKIYLNSAGAIIKFGKNFTEQAEANSCSYFLYGGEVTDIKYEFSEGDDIFFDAVKIKSKWKAVLVWVGEKPVCFNIKKAFSENKSEVSDDESVSSSKASSIRHSPRPITDRTKSFEQNKIPDYSNSKKYGKFNERSKKPTSRPPNPAIFSTKNSRNEYEKKINETDNLLVNRRGINKNRRGNVRKLTSRVEKKKSIFNRNVNCSYDSDEEKNETADVCKEHFTFKDSYSSQDDSDNEVQDNDKYLVTKRVDKNFFNETADICKDHHTFKSSYSSQDDSDNEGQGNFKYLVAKKVDESCFNTHRDNFSITNDNGVDNSYEIKLNNKNMATIKKFYDVEGQIIKLHCKAAFVESSCLQNSMNFMLSRFYLNGKAVEELQFLDLRELMKVGETIKFNCFEIIDDGGNYYQNVTTAWKGPKPEVSEMAPEDFIIEHGLSVTINKELEPKSLSEKISCSKNLLRDKDLKNTSESSDENEFEEMSSDDNNLRTFNSNSVKKEDILDVNKSINETVLERLKYKRLIPTDVQIDFSCWLSEIIDLVQKHTDRYNSVPLNQSEKENPKSNYDLVCSLCEKTVFEENKTINDAVTQTIVTGGIISQNDHFSL